MQYGIGSRVAQSLNRRIRQDKYNARSGGKVIMCIQSGSLYGLYVKKKENTHDFFCNKPIPTVAYLGHGEKTNYSANPPGRNSQSARAE